MHVTVTVVGYYMRMCTHFVNSDTKCKVHLPSLMLPALCKGFSYFTKCMNSAVRNMDAKVYDTIVNSTRDLCKWLQ